MDFRANKGGTMSVISIVSVSEAAAGDQSFKNIALFSCIGLVASLCLMIAGVEPSMAWV